MREGLKQVPNRRSRFRAGVVPSLLLLGLLAITDTRVMGEEPTGVPPAPPTAHCGPACTYEDDCDWGFCSDPVWIFCDVNFYVKAGTVHPLGGGFFEDRIQGGFGVQVGAQQPICCLKVPVVLFGELGGGYAQNEGQTAPVTPDTFFDPDLMELRRAHIHAALGADWFPRGRNSCKSCEVHFQYRAGIRVGHIHAAYEQTVLPIDVKETENFLGFFTSVGVHLTWHDVCIYGRCKGDVSVGAEIEFAHDAFDLGTFGIKDEGLGTVAPLFSVSFSY